MIGGKAPSLYLKEIEKRAGISRNELNSTLETHLIDPSLLREDEFVKFIDARRTELLELIASATGKAMGAAVDEPEPIESDVEEEGETDDSLEEAA